MATLDIDIEEGGGGRGFTCEICMEPTTQRRRFRNGDICGHDFCCGCIGEYVRLQIGKEDAVEIRCPALRCPKILDVNSCGRIIPKAHFLLWCDRLCEMAIVGFDQSKCPNPDCSGMGPILSECGEEDAAAGRSSSCPKCKQHFCFRCGRQWRADHRCSGVRRVGGDAMLRRLMELRGWRRCPGCSQAVSLGSGCNRIRCRCGTRFCYGCGHRNCTCKRSTREIIFAIAMITGILVIALLFAALLARGYMYFGFRW